LEKKLKEYTKRLGLNDSVIFTGAREDIPEFLNALDLFVLCSTSEGLSITLLEAMSAGLPIIATDVGGNSEAIKNNQSGMLIKNDDIDALFDAMIYMIENNDYRRKIAENAKNRFEQFFSIKRMAANMQNLYQSLLKGGN